MSSVVCKNGHQSETDDYCSVCGVAIDSVGGLATAGPPAASGATCPECGTARADPGARFCEVCRHDFQTGTASPATPIQPPAPVPTPIAVPAPSASPAVTTSGPAPGNAKATAEWEAVVAVDPLLDVDPDPQLPCPVGDPDRRFPIDLPQMLIGRRDDRRDIRPEIPVGDPAVSHRHAQLLRLPDGTVAVRDLASKNGTFVNGSEIPPGTTFTLQIGDVINVGRWTKITLNRG